jgi:hypothetical protein
VKRNRRQRRERRLPRLVRAAWAVGWPCFFAAPVQAAESEAAGATAIVVAFVTAVASVVVAYLGLRQSKAAKTQATQATTELDDFKAKFVHTILEEKTLETIKLQGRFLRGDEVCALTMQCLLQENNLDWLRKQGRFASTTSVETERRRVERLVRALEERLEKKLRPLEESIVDLAGAFEHLQIAISPDQISERALAAATERVQTVRRRRRPG